MAVMIVNRSLKGLACFLSAFSLLQGPQMAMAGQTLAAFHAPQTAAEEALNAALHDGDAGEGAMTSALSAAVKKAKGKKDCPGSFHGELCEMARRAITCNAVPHDFYVFRTTSAAADEATIDATWPDFASAAAPEWKTYRLVRKDGMWALDGIDCGGLYKFNISTQELLGAFHRPASGPEKSLDKILQIDRAGPALGNFVLKLPGRLSARKNMFSHLFTKPLLDAWQEAQSTAARQECGGKYVPGEMCGLMDHSVVSCGQDGNDVYFYRTIRADARQATVTYTWPSSMTDGPVYRMVNIGGSWKLDGVDCGGTEKYHFR